MIDTSEVVLKNGGMTTTRTLSDFVRTPSEVIAQLEKGDVVLTRRGDVPLRLSTAERQDDKNELLTLLSRLIAASLDDHTCTLLGQQLVHQYPWIEFLPERDRREFVGDFFRKARASLSIDHFDQLAVCVAAWKSTATAYADPSTAIDASDLTPIPGGEPVERPS